MIVSVTNYTQIMSLFESFVKKPYPQSPENQKAKAPTQSRYAIQYDRQTSATQPDKRESGDSLCQRAFRSRAKFNLNALNLFLWDKNYTTATTEFRKPSFRNLDVQI